MTRPIRAFLMLRTADDWAVSVCRDLEAVVEAWAARQDAATAGVLHIGFDRPPSAAFEEVVRSHPGRLLVTAAAKFGLPAELVASDFPVGFVGTLPVHLALRGWGYVLEDDPAWHVAEAAPRSVLGDRSGWVAAFVAARPDLAEDFDRALITDEHSYAEREDLLGWDARYRAGQFRFRSLMDGADDDPCAIARAAPPWLTERSFSTFTLPVRASNVLINKNVETVAELGAVGIADVLRWQNFGRKSARDIASALLSALEEGPFSAEAQIARAGAESLRLELQRTLAGLDERERDILSRRMGLGRSAETLQTIAEDYGVTRERIRQIEAKVVKRTIKEAYWDDLLTGKLEALLSGREYPLPLLGIEAVDPWFDGIAQHPEAIRYILANFCGGHIGIVQIDSVDYFGFLQQSEWDAALHEARRVLDFSAGKQWTEHHCKALLAPLIKEASTEFRGLLWEKATTLCHFSEGGQGERILLSYGRGAEQLVEAILAEAGRPLHYSEIVTIAHQQGRTLDPRRAHNAAAAVGILVGRGTYGLEQHFRLTTDQTNLVIDEAESIVLAGPAGRQWHASELYSALVERDVVPEGLDKYVLDFLLRRSSVLRRLGRMAWVQSNVTVSDRLEVREAVIDLLEQAGRPLTTTELRQRLIARRGVNATFQVQPADPLVRVGTGVWGLNDRDLPLKRANQAEFNEKLVHRLAADGHGLHVSELGDLIRNEANGLTPAMAFSIAALDTRMAVSIGQHLYLREWGGPRREALTESVREIMLAADRPMSLDDLGQRASERTGRHIDRARLSASLQSLEAKFDPVGRMWSLPSSMEEADDPDALAEDAA